MIKRVVCRQLIGVALALPEAPTAAAHIPVRQLVNEAFNLSPRLGGVIALQPPIDIGDKLVKL
ncbi:hypothetical protein ES703_106743 [subsurface metagenome]